MSGTTPQGIRDEQQAAAWVREMFGKVAPRYDLLNHLLSFNVDRYWRRRTVAAVRAHLKNENARVLDVCCGTGDLALALQRSLKAQVYGSDFCHPMLLAAGEKGSVPLFESDALQLPVADGSVDALTVAFGFRNLTNYERGLAEIARVLRPGGLAAILEFSQPPNQAFASLYNWYSRAVLPKIGAALSGSAEAYRYLPESVRKFPGAEELADKMRAGGFKDVGFERLTFGIVALHTGTKG